MEHVVVERTFKKTVTEEKMRAKEEAIAWCSQQHHVRLVCSYLSPDGLRAICVYEAPDAEAVRSVNRVGEMPYESLWTATLVQPEVAHE